MVGFLFVVLLPFSYSVAIPTEVSKAFCTLNLGAPRLNHDNRHFTFRVGTRFRAIFHVKFVEDLLRVSVVFENILNLLIALKIHQVNPIDRATFERVIAIVTI